MKRETFVALKFFFKHFGNILHWSNALAMPEDKQTLESFQALLREYETTLNGQQKALGYSCRHIIRDAIAGEFLRDRLTKLFNPEALEPKTLEEEWQEWSENKFTELKAAKEPIKKTIYKFIQVINSELENKLIKMMSHFIASSQFPASKGVATALLRQLQVLPSPPPAPVSDGPKVLFMRDDGLCGPKPSMTTAEVIGWALRRRVEAEDADNASSHPLQSRH